MFLFHYKNEDGELVDWYINTAHLIDIAIIEGKVYVTTTATDGEGWLVEEAPEDIKRMLDCYWHIFSKDTDVDALFAEDLKALGENENGI